MQELRIPRTPEAEAEVERLRADLQVRRPTLTEEREAGAPVAFPTMGQLGTYLQWLTAMKRLRKERALSAEEVARRMGVAVAALERLEAAKELDPPMSLLQAYAQTLGHELVWGSRARETLAASS